MKMKKPAAGGGAAGFSKRTEQRLGGGVPLFLQTTLGRRSGPSETRSFAGGGASLRYIWFYSMRRGSPASMLQCSYAFAAILPRQSPGLQSPSPKSSEHGGRLAHGPATSHGSASAKTQWLIIESSISGPSFDLFEGISALRRACGQFVRIPFM